MVCHVYIASSNRAYATEFYAGRRPCCTPRRHVSMQAGTGSTAVGTRSTDGKSVQAQSLRIQRLVGQGSFGEVFEGICLDNQETHRVIMKRVKSKTAGAEEIGENEHKLNVYVQKNAAGSCADFFGYTIVERSDRVPDKRITPGKWLLWKYQGLKTLRDYLSRRDCLTALAVDLRVPEHVVIPTVIVQLFQCVQKLHAAGLVHRDVKPSNIILCEEDSTFRLIDLGAMADLRTGMNYVPGESILDPYYCPPEQYVLPTDTPDLANTNRMMSLAMSTMLWNRHKPDRFDSYSIGLILLQLAVPQLRMKSGLQSFHKSFKTCRYDLMRWRTISSLTPQQTAVLDANDGAGWDLAAALLRPRKVQVLNDGHVYFTNEGKQRPSAEAALQHRFLAPAFNPNLTPEELAQSAASSGGSRSWLGLFSLVQNRVTNLEDEISQTAQQAEETSTTIQKLRARVDAGDGSELELERAEGVLSNLTGSLNYLQTEMKVALRGARRAFRQGFGEESESEIEIPALTPNEEYELQKKIAADETAAANSKTPPTAVSTQWSLAGAMLSGIQSMGRAVQVSGDVVERINLETQAALEKRNNLNSDEEKFISMLEQAQIRASARWPSVAEHFAADPRFTAIPEGNRFVLFRSYIRMQQDMHALKLDDTEMEYMRRLVQRVTSSSVTWASIQRAWQREAFFRAVDPAAAETLFIRHIAKLQQDEAADARERAAELSFRSALESLEPGVSPRCSWKSVQGRVPRDSVYDLLDTSRREAIFEDVRDAAAAAEAQAQAAAAAEASLLRARHEQQERQEREAQQRGDIEAGSDAESDRDRQILSNLRAEQARLKEEYEKMERKLKEMESRLEETQTGGNGWGATGGTQPEERMPAVSSGNRSLNGTGK